MANDFSGDSNCVALWRFENGALMTDSSGNGNTLTASASSPTADTVNYKEGAASADFELDNTQNFTRTDANLSSNFPFKNGTSNLVISASCWIKPETVTGYGAHRIWVKNTSSLCAFLDALYTDGSQTRFALSAGGRTYHSGAVYAVAGRWYHIGIVVDGTNDPMWYAMRVWDDTAEAVIFNRALADCGFAGQMAVNTNAWYVDYTSSCFDGLVDELVVFNDILTTTEIDQIRQGTYGAAAATYSGRGIARGIGRGIMR